MMLIQKDAYTCILNLSTITNKIDAYTDTLNLSTITNKKMLIQAPLI